MSATTKTTKTATNRQHFGEFGTSTTDLLHGLLMRAQPNMSAADLVQMEELTGQARLIVAQLAHVTEGLGVLIGDEANDDAGRTGCFQSAESVSALLLMLSSAAGHAAGLMTLACTAGTLAAGRDA